MTVPSAIDQIHDRLRVVLAGRAEMAENIIGLGENKLASRTAFDVSFEVG